MSSAVTTLVLANLGYWLVGIGAFLALGFVDRRESTWTRLPAAYLFGICVVLVPSTYLALLGVAVGWTMIALAAFVLVVVGVVRASRGRVPVVRASPVRARAVWLSGALAGVLFALAGYVLVVAGRAFAVSPLSLWDGWVVWALKARVLYELPADAPGILRGSNYGPPSYPLAMPELESLGFRAIGHFDGALIDLQLLALAFGLLGTMWSLSRGRARSLVVAITALAVLTAPQFLLQLGTNFVDIPLAVLVASALLAAARWLSIAEGDGWSLACFVAFAGLAGLFKNEGTMFAFAAIVALLICARLTGGRRVRDAALASLGVLVLILPWRIYGAAYRLPTDDYDLANLVNPVYLAHHADRVQPIVSELASELSDQGRWGLLLPVVACSLVAGLLSRRWTVGLFATVWVALACVGLTATYWVSVLPLTNDLWGSSYRTVASIILGAACLTPILIDDAITVTLRAAARSASHVRARLVETRAG